MMERECSCGSGLPSWWAKDAQGIELCRVCDECENAKLSEFRPEILTGYSQADVDERIEPDEEPIEPYCDAEYNGL